MHRADEKIVASFGNAALGYDLAASLQKEVAAGLVALIAEAAPKTILDLGCGTGLVTSLARQLWPAAQITALDAAPAMVAETRRKIPEAQVLIADAAQVPMREGHFDLILSSMMLQWLPDPAQAVQDWKNHLTPQGRMAIALPIAGSLIEWKDLCRESGVLDKLWPFPDASVFQESGLRATIKPYPRTYASAQAFLKSMKDTGAACGHPTAPPMPPSDLRHVLRRGGKPFTATYRVLFLH